MASPAVPERFMTARACLALPLAALLALAAAPPPPDPDAPAFREALARAGVQADTPSLLAFFRRRTPSGAEQARLAALVRRLGDEDFDTREQATRDLGDAGRAALPYLRAALADPDREV